MTWWQYERRMWNQLWFCLKHGHNWARRTSTHWYCWTCFQGYAPLLTVGYFLRHCIGTLRSGH